MEQDQLLVPPPPKHPLEVFSAEVWTMILEKIEEPKDVWNISNVHTLFRGILQEKKEAWNAVLFSVALPQLKGRLGANELLALRQVSRDLKNAVDELLESEKPPLKANGGDVCSRDISFDIRSESACSRLLTKMRDNPDCKLVGGSVTMSIMRDFLFESQGEFIEEQGGKILDLIIRLENVNSPLTQLEVAECLRFVLEKTPKLKKLTVCYSGGGISGEKLGLSPRDLCETVQEDLWEEHPFPDLDDLKFLLIQRTDVTEQEAATCIIFQTMLEAYQDQVESLGLLNLESPPVSPAPFGRMKMLKDLHVGTSITSTLDTMWIIGAPLCKVSININDGQHIELSDIFKLLTFKFGNTLKEIVIINVQDKKEVAPEVQLPKLEKLKMLNFHISSWTVFDVLLKFPRLRQVDIAFLMGTDSGAGVGDREPPVVDVEPYLKEDGLLDKSRFKESPIWQRLPRLQSVNLRKLQFPNNRCFPDID